MGGGIWAFAEVRDGEFPEESLELLCEARRLADRRPGERVGAVVLGARAGALAETAARHGASEVFWSDDGRFLRYAPEPFTAAIAELLERRGPGCFLLPDTDAGADLAPRIAARLRAGLLPSCDRLEISGDGILTGTRLSHGRKVQATVCCRNARLQVATVTPGIAKVRAAGPPGGEPPALVRLPAGADPRPGRVVVTGVVAADPATVDIADAEILVAGGKGACGDGIFRLVRELADALGASVAGSREAVDAGCLPRDRQIGQSGKCVSPKLLFSCGISGAHAHLAGMREAGTVVAINTDRDAPMMRLADLAVVGDLRAVLPALAERLRARASPLRAAISTRKQDCPNNIEQL